MMLIPKAAKRYALAWYNLAEEAGKVNAVYSDCEKIASVINEADELKSLLDNQIIGKDQKLSVLTSVFSDVNEETTQLFNLLVKKHRENLLGSVAGAFKQVYNQRNHICEAIVRYPMELEEEQVGQLKQALEQRTGQSVRLQLVHDTSLLGGLTIQIGDTVIDGSVKNKIQQLDHLFHGSAA